MISPATPELITINQVEPIYVTFGVPESYINDVKKYMAAGTLRVIATPQDEASSAQTGKLTFIDNTVDPTTGTIKLKGTFPNTDRKLWPGQFVKVNLRLATMKDALVLPNQAVQTGQEGLYVYVVKADRKVEMRTVTTGARVDQDLVILSGVEEGETVVTDGHLRLSPGMTIQDRKGKGGKGGKGGGGGEGKKDEGQPKQ